MARSTPTPATKAPVAKPAPTPSPVSAMVTPEKIAQRAYEKWCGRGMPCGTAQQDWLEAECELKTEISKNGKK